MNQFDRQNPDLIKFGMFYFNRNDADLFAKKVSGLGWAVNFANPIAYVLIGFIVAIAITFEVYS